MEIVKNLLLFLQAVTSLVLVYLVMTQSSKNEGFGTIGVQTPTNFKGKPGFEERMRLYTRNVAIGWIILGLVVAFAFRTS